VQQLDSVDLDALSQRILASHAALQARVHAGLNSLNYLYSFNPLNSLYCLYSLYSPPRLVQ